MQKSSFFPQSDTCFKCCNCFLQDHIRTRFSLNKTYRMSCHLWTVPPQKPAFRFLLCFCLCVAKLKVVFFFWSLYHQRQAGSPSKRGRRADRWTQQSTMLRHRPLISHLECVNQDSVYAQLCSSDRFIQRELVFRGLQRQRICKLFAAVYHRNQSYSKDGRS